MKKGRFEIRGSNARWEEVQERGRGERIGKEGRRGREFECNCERKYCRDVQRARAVNKP